MTWKAPEWVKAFAGSKTSQSAPAGASSEQAATAETPGNPQEPKLPTLAQLKIDVDGSSDMGVRIFRTVVADTIRRMNEAAVAGSHREYNRLLNELADQLDALRKNEAAALKAAEINGEALRTRVLTSETVSTFTTLAYSFTNALMSLAEKLAPQVPVAERRALVLPLRDDVYGFVKKTRYREAWEITRSKLATEPAWTCFKAS